ncbi:MAG: hypothetical protein K0S41_1216 [Anaerocolumna sp.]|jgi:hypothetical protein|nr:hypothetical protein [Anaerocolumna sp.]
MKFNICFYFIELKMINNENNELRKYRKKDNENMKKTKYEITKIM